MTHEVDPKHNPPPGQATGAFMPAAEEAQGTSLLDLLIVLAERKLVILLSTLIFGVAATVIALVTPPMFTATAVILPPQQASSSAAALLGQLGGIAGVAGQSLGIKNPSDIYIGILSSRTVMDKLVTQHSLKDVYDVETLTDARRKLSKYSSFNAAKYSMIHISVEDRDPRRAADLANAYVKCLQEQNSRLAVSEAAQRRLFFERELDKEKALLVEAETAMQKMQEQKGLFQVSSQVSAVIQSMAQLRAEIVAREVALERLKAGATGQNPEVQGQKIEIEALRAQMKELEAKSTRDGSNPFMPTSMVPAAALDYARRLREVRYHEALYELLARQYEVARIDEARESPVIQVVDQAVPPEKKSAPRRSYYLIIGLFLGAVVGMVLALGLQAAEDESVSRKIDAIRKSIFSQPVKSARLD
ncbi:MAG: Wzz/FepE/Etk N-terminal domain-containing protein [Acidobacteriota bacterium]|nr:Wzz/FepE/Etk N-terminal domain-containing protein [Acidobacteriota bacterium]